MTSNDLRILLDHPFQPLDLVLSDGSRVLVTDPDHVTFRLSTMMVGEGHDETGWPQRTRWIDVRHIVQATQALVDDDPTSM